jgi:hypothetical protein
MYSNKIVLKNYLFLLITMGAKFYFILIYTIFLMFYLSSWHTVINSFAIRKRRVLLTSFFEIFIKIDSLSFILLIILISRYVSIDKISLIQLNL